MTEPDVGRTPRIVVGVDGSDSSQEALKWAARQALLTGAVVEAVTAWQMPTSYGYPLAVAPLSTPSEIAQRILNNALDQAAQPPGAQAEMIAKVVEGNAAQVLIDEARGADLLVVGSRGHGGFAEALLGSTGQHCVHHATCPVVVVRDSVVSHPSD
jgi:nucleotide-binding universal stress UspA family protein